MRRIVHVRNGQGLGAETPGGSSFTSQVTAEIAAALQPRVRQIVNEDVLPAVILGLVAGAAVAAAIGSYFATRTSGARRAPEILRRRRSA